MTLKQDIEDRCRKVNHNTRHNRIRVMCNFCGTSGAHGLDYQPKCHHCGSMMHPASNNNVECTWEQYQKFIARTAQ